MEDQGSYGDRNAGFGSTDAQWHHIAVTWASADGHATLYLDGRKVWLRYTVQWLLSGRFLTQLLCLRKPCSFVPFLVLFCNVLDHVRSKFCQLSLSICVLGHGLTSLLHELQRLKQVCILTSSCIQAHIEAGLYRFGHSM